MENETKKHFEAERASQRLEGKWRVWEGFQGKVSRDSSYTANMSMVFPIESVEDLAYLFKHTSYSQPSNFFYSLEDQTVKRYEPRGLVVEVGPNAGRRRQFPTGRARLR